MKDGVIHYLLVQAEQDRAEWVLPKGHIEPGEDPHETAVREVNEETGYWAGVKKWVRDMPFDKGAGGVDLVRFYRMELARDKEMDDKTWPPENRQHQWLPLAEAQKLATYPETKNLLNEVDALIELESKAVS